MFCARSSWTRGPWGMCGTWMLSAVYSPCLLSSLRNRWKGKTSCDSKTSFSPQLSTSDRQLTLPPVLEAPTSEVSHKWNWKNLISQSLHTSLSLAIDIHRDTRRCGLSRKNTGLWTLLCQCPHVAGHPCITVTTHCFSSFSTVTSVEGLRINNQIGKHQVCLWIFLFIYLRFCSES